MNPRHPQKSRFDSRNIHYFALLTTCVTVVGLIVFSVEGFFREFALHPVNQPIVWLLLAAGPFADLLMKALDRLGRLDPGIAKTAFRIRTMGDRIRDSILKSRSLASIITVLSLVLFCVFWIPEYLLQPLWTDHEHMLVMAHLWDIGMFPWTAMRTYQFPGGMEISWLSAQLFGWGNPIGFYVSHLMLMFSVGWILTKWSSRQFGSWVYGLASFIALILVEAAQPFSTVAQRDTQATLIAMISFLTPAAFKNRTAGLICSGISFAFALAMRPHVLLFAPVIICGIFWERVVWFDRSSTSDETDRTNEIPMKRIAILWIASFALSLILFLSPVIGTERTSKFLEAMRFPTSQEGDYANGVFAFWERTLTDYYAVKRHLLFLSLSVCMILIPSAVRWKRLGGLMLLIAVCGGVYRAVHPVDHGYLKLPLQFWECLGACVFPAWLFSNARSMHTYSWFSGFGFVLIVILPNSPLYVTIEDFPEAVNALVSNRPLPQSPPGARDAYPLGDAMYHYRWSDWKQAEAWLRDNTNESTRIMNLLSYQPYPSFLGTVGRLPMGRLESIVLLNWFKKYDFEAEIIEALKSAPQGSIVIWDSFRTNPDNRSQIAESSTVIREFFTQAEIFGEIELWVK